MKWPNLVRNPAMVGLLIFLVGCAQEAPVRESGEGGVSSVKPRPEAVAKMIEAHGGIETWRSAPSVRFTEQWGEREPTRIIVEQGPRRVYMETVGGGARMAWDGKQAWSIEWKGPPPRFMAHLNYYFVNLPWLTMDPGVLLSEPGKDRLWDDPTVYTTVMMTFEEGVGDTPDDYYELYIHPDTYRLHACKYIVTYDALLPPGEEHTPEHILVYDEYVTIDGLVVPAHFTIYETDRTVYATCAISDWSFDEPFDETLVEMPEGAVIDTTTP